MIASLLVPLDGSRFGEEALRYAIEIARRARATLHVVHVHVPPAFGRYPDLYVDKDREIRADEQLYLEHIAHCLEKTEGVQADIRLLDGEPVAAIREQAVAVSSDLVVLSTHGRGPLNRLWLGSVTDGLVRCLPMAVLLVRPRPESEGVGHTAGFHNLVIALDGSTESEEILKPALELGKLLSCEYTLFQAVAPVPLVGVDITGYSGGAIDLQLVEQLQESARAYLDRVAAPLRSQGWSVRTRVMIHSSAASAILDQAHEKSETLIALTTHGRAGLSRLLLGSVADKVVRGATVPVLVHRSPG